MKNENVLINQGHSIDQWQELVSMKLGRLDTQPVSRCGTFAGRLAQQPFGTLNCVDLRSTQLTIIRREQFINNTTEDVFKINFHLAGTAELLQNGRFATLHPGQWVIYDNAQPYTLTFHQNYHQLVLLVPRQQLLSQLPNLNQIIGQPRSFKEPSLSRFVYQFLQVNLHQPRPASANLLTADNMLVDLITSALLKNTNTRDASTLATIKQYIHTNLMDPCLSAQSVANGCHISKRYLHHLFASEGITAVNYIWAMRLEKCRLALLLPQNKQQTVTDIAFRWGFNSAAHFSRRFKQAFGVSPTTLRPSLHSQSSN